MIHVTLDLSRLVTQAQAYAANAVWLFAAHIKENDNKKRKIITKTFTVDEIV